jgi:hypothetical protein
MNISKMKSILLCASIAVMAAYLIPTSAVALPTEGPWWSVGGGLPPEGVTKSAISGKVVGGLSLYGKFSSKFIEIACTTGESTVSIYNGGQQAEGEEKIILSKCGNIKESTSMKGTYKEVKSCAPQSEIKTEPIKSSGWYLTSSVGKTRTSTTVFLNAANSGTTIASITLSGEGCGVLEGVFKVEGTVISKVKPENTEAEKETTVFPSEQQLHLWRPTTESKVTEAQALLSFDHTEAQLQGEIEMGLASKEEIGVASGFTCGPGNPDMSWYIDYPACSMRSVNRRGDYERFPNF